MSASQPSSTSRSTDALAEQALAYIREINQKMIELQQLEQHIKELTVQQQSAEQAYDVVLDAHHAALMQRQDLDLDKLKNALMDYQAAQAQIEEIKANPDLSASTKAMMLPGPQQLLTKNQQMIDQLLQEPDDV
jgi:vacuolar-type H+-ATPase subunit I/STV1